ncbi:MAG: PilZ domain-containing protein [Planctomycetes bacterium]|nr:PilZ domain-containing protein [Planctomycetota bacterium]
MAQRDNRERREFIRIAVELVVRYRFLPLPASGEGESPAPLRQGFTANISQSGLVLVCELPPEDLLVPMLKKQVELEIRFAVPDTGSPREATGRTRIAWIDLDIVAQQCQLGLEFVDLAERDRVALFKYALAAANRPGDAWA